MMSITYSRKLKIGSEPTKRITISFEREVARKVMELQQLMADSGKEWSLSKIINTLLMASLLYPELFQSGEWRTLKKFSLGKKILLDDVRLEEYVINLISLHE